MSLLNLSNTASRGKTKVVSVEQFIDGAIAYSMGNQEESEDVISTTSAVSARLTPRLYENQSKSTRAVLTQTKHATFSLSEQCIEQLNALSLSTNISKSRIVRILVDSQHNQHALEALVDSNTP